MTTPTQPGAVSEAMRAWLQRDETCVDEETAHQDVLKRHCPVCIATEAQRLSDAALRELEARLRKIRDEAQAEAARELADAEGSSDCGKHWDAGVDAGFSSYAHWIAKQIDAALRPAQPSEEA